jgi:hypothetical protein
MLAQAGTESERHEDMRRICGAFPRYRLLSRRAVRLPLQQRSVHTRLRNVKTSKKCINFAVNNEGLGNVSKGVL